MIWLIEIIIFLDPVIFFLCNISVLIFNFSLKDRFIILSPP